MNEALFKKSLTKILLMHQVLINKEHNDQLFELMKDDFTDKEFEIICSDIIKTETLYNKYPIPSIFYARKPSKVQIENANLTIEFEKFFSLVNVQLQSVLPSLSIDGFSSLERKTLMSQGGFEELWCSVNKEEPQFNRSIAGIRKEMEKFYMDNYKNEKILAVTGESCQKISDLTKGIGV